MPASLLRIALLAGLAAMSLAAAQTPAAAADATCSRADASAHRTCTVPINKSLILDLPRDASDVLVSNPDIADAVVRTARRIYLTGNNVGETNLFVFDQDGGVIVSMDLTVARDISGLQDTLARLIPGSAITVENINDSIVLSGTVANAADAGRAAQIAGLFASGDGSAGVTPAAGSASGSSSIVNLLTIEGQDQVALKVTIAEIDRNTVKQLGIDWGLDNLNVGDGMVFSSVASRALAGVPGFTASHVGNTIVPAAGGDPGASVNQRSSISATVQALEQQGLVRTLAEPTLTAISGEDASFLAGGEFPVQVNQDGTVTVTYKPYGVSLDFTPTVLSAGRISLHISTEVSEVVGTSGALTVRRASSTLELPSGGSMVMSGLLQDNVSETNAGLPGIRDLPVIGALFGSRDFQREETELVIIVTPYLVSPVARSDLARPDDGFAPPTDASAIFLGQLNRQYGTLGDTGSDGLRGTYQGNVGFIFE